MNPATLLKKLVSPSDEWTITAMAAKGCNTLLFSYIEPKIKKILRKIKTALKEISPQPHKFW